MSSQSPLWSGRKVQEPDHAWLAPPPRKPEPPPEAPPPPPRRSRLGMVLGLLAALVLVGGGSLAAGLWLGEGDGPGAEEVEPLPAAGGKLAATRINQIYDRVSEGVVNVRTGGGTGTGFVVDRDGTIVTNAHVVGRSERVSVRFDDNGEPVRAEVAGSDPSSDLAVLRIDPDDAPRLKVLPFADSDDVRVGDNAVAIGYPLGLDRTATAGIVSGLGREIRAPNGFTIEEVIQTDAPINPGNSGGPLLDSRGRVIGVNSQIATAGSAGNVGIGFAVPSNTVREVLPQLKRGARVRRPYLGVSTAPAVGTSGAAVREVDPGGPASDAGLRRGDVIVRVGGKEVGTPDDVSRSLDGQKPGDRVAVEVRRGGRSVSLDVELGLRPDRFP